MKIVLASRNRHKIEEWNATLGRYMEGVEILSLDDVGVSGEIEEDGATFEENALIKAEAAAGRGYISIGEDSGLEVDALGGEPGVYSARYAGEHGNDEANNRLLLTKLEGVSNRRGRFVCAIGVILPDGERFSVRGETEGVILEAPRGEGGFGYDPLFLYEPAGKTFSEMSGEEKNRISHRAVAIERLAKKLKNIH